MSVYLAINISIILIPLLLSFEKKIAFYKKFTAVFLSVISVGLIFIVWDSMAAKHGDWKFNPEYVSGVTLFNLPVEEWLFFITVPYSILFIYECVRYYIKEKMFSINPNFCLIFSFIFLMNGLIFINESYTVTIMLYCAALMMIIYFLNLKFIFTKTYIMTLLISFIPFLIVNYILTSLPIISYNPDSITGLKFFTIPAEDFFYSFAMITGWILVYNSVTSRVSSAIIINDKSPA